MSSTGLRLGIHYSHACMRPSCCHLRCLDNWQLRLQETLTLVTAIARESEPRAPDHEAQGCSHVLLKAPEHTQWGAF